MPSYFVTGTDTGVGKTRVACRLLRAFAAAGAPAIGMKPVAAGREAGRWQDVEALRAASTVAAPAELVNPYAFVPAIAPHIAAEEAREEIVLERIAACHRRLCALAGTVIVEGAGGFMIPLNRSETSADLARALGCPMILVVGMRLGCLNHALLTREAIARAGLECAGWVANCIVPAMPRLEANIAALEARLGCPRLGTLVYQPEIDCSSAGALDIALLAR